MVAWWVVDDKSMTKLEGKIHVPVIFFFYTAFSPADMERAIKTKKIDKGDRTMQSFPERNAFLNILIPGTMSSSLKSACGAR